MANADILDEARGLVVSPVHNEQETLGEVVRELRSTFPSRSLLFVNDGSTDESQRILRESALPYVTHPVNLGYQEALKTGGFRGGLALPYASPVRPKFG